jgi:hypothetical protein
MQKKIFLEQEIVFISVIKFLSISDFLNLSNCNKKLRKYINFNYVWKEKNLTIINPKHIIKNYKNQFIYNYRSKDNNICSICNDYIIQDFYISMHNCNYGFTKCVKCLDFKCTCSEYLSFHSKCVKKDNFNIIECPLCKSKIAAYHINYNV